MDDAPPAASTTDRRWRRPDPMWLVAAVAVLPIVVHVVRYLVDGAAPIGDAAYFTVRSVDVGTRHHPLLGAWSSGSAALTAPVNNLGPLQLDLLAPFTKVAPFAGTFVGIAAMNAAAVVGVGVAARRVGGRGMAIVALATISVVTWSLGSFLLVDARQQHALMLPFGCLLFLCWVVTAGDRAAAPFAVLTGSLIVQTHLSYLFPVVAVAVATVTVAVIGWWRSRRAVDPPASTRWYVRPTAISVVVLAVCWVQPLIDQLWGRGNMRNLLGAADEGKPGPGLGRGLRILATVLTDPSAWGREGFARFDPAFRLVGTGRAAVGLFLIVGVLVGVAVLARRRADRPLAAGATIAVAALAGGALAGARLPGGAFGIVAANYRWLWPVLAFVLFTAAAGALDVAGRSARWSRRVATIAVIGGGAVAVTFAVAGLPRSSQLWSSTDRRKEVITADLLDQLRAAPLTGPVVLDRSAESFGTPYAYPVMAVLQERGVEFLFDPWASVDIARFGDEREAGAVEAPRLALITGEAALEASGGTVIALVRSLSADEEERRRMLTAQILLELRGGRYELADLPDGFVDARYPAIGSFDEGGRPGDEALLVDASGLLRAGALALTDVPAGDAADWLRSNDQVADSVALVLDPVG